MCDDSLLRLYHLLGLSFFVHQEKYDSDCYRPDTSPCRNVYGLFLFDLNLNLAEFCIVGLLGVGELTINQPKRTGNNQYYCHDFNFAHLSSPLATRCILPPQPHLHRPRRSLFLKIITVLKNVKFCVHPKSRFRNYYAFICLSLREPEGFVAISS